MPNVENFLKLAAVLESSIPQASFDMSLVAHGQSGLELTPEHVCNSGTVACAIGWAPAYVAPAIKGEDWQDYCERVFDIEWCSEEWEFIFGGGWSCVDDTPQGAGARVRYFLDKGLPDPDLDFKDLLEIYAPYLIKEQS